jgi:hypothetical protein
MISYVKNCEQDKPPSALWTLSTGTGNVIIFEAEKSP